MKFFFDKGQGAFKTIRELEFHIDQKEMKIIVSVHKKLKKMMTKSN